MYINFVDHFIWTCRCINILFCLTAATSCYYCKIYHHYGLMVIMCTSIINNMWMQIYSTKLEKVHVHYFLYIINIKSVICLFLKKEGCTKKRFHSKITLINVFTID